MLTDASRLCGRRERCDGGELRCARRGAQVQPNSHFSQPLWCVLMLTCVDRFLQLLAEVIRMQRLMRLENVSVEWRWHAS
eukprot:6211029-Pleurochrysis_carterae.AAC.3